MINPTIITITGPSASGKTFMFEEMRRRGYEKFVSTTTRSIRDGEVDGEDYHFITERRSLEIERVGGFAELVTYNGNRYGITIEEVNQKLARGRPVAVILTPDGVQIYRRLAKLVKAHVLSVFVDTRAEVRLNRIAARTLQQLDNPKINRARFVKDLVYRLAWEFPLEESWRDEIQYDLIVPGDDVQTALGLIGEAERKVNAS